MLSPVSIQTQSLALRALRKRKPQETKTLAFLAVFVYATHATQAIAFEWVETGLYIGACFSQLFAFLFSFFSVFLYARVSACVLCLF